MDAQTDKIARRKRKAPQRRVPAVIEERERKPMFLRWGADLNHHQREALKERIALFAGIVIALLVAGLVGWGLLQDNVIGPADQRAADSKPIAQIGTYTVTTGFFKRFEQFRNTQLNSQVTQLQQAIQQLNATPKKNASLISQYQSQLSAIQQSLSSVAQDSLQLLLDDQAMIQRSKTVGVVATPKEVNDQIIVAEKNAGGRLHFQQFLKTSNLSYSEFKWLVTGDVLRTELSKKLAATVNPYETKVRASHILVASNKKALAQKLYTEVKNGANIAPLAAKYSTDPGSKKKGGDLGYFARGAMVAPFDNAAFSMKVGQVRLVQSQYGWHVIKVTGRKRMHMTSQELQTAKASALQSWLNKQEGILHIQRFIATTALPTVTTANSSVNGVQQTNPLQMPTTVPTSTG
ncbi:MAG TPA: peptidylprolyl isomerase [Chloroflexota bacterium]